MKLIGIEKRSVDFFGKQLTLPLYTYYFLRQFSDWEKANCHCRGTAVCIGYSLVDFTNRCPYLPNIKIGDIVTPVFNGDFPEGSSYLIDIEPGIDGII